MYYIHDIKIPTLILSAANDPFLSESCYPFDACATNQNVLLEITRFGGHTGFKTNNNNYYHELRSLAFMQSRS